MCHLVRYTLLAVHDFGCASTVVLASRVTQMQPYL